jgi:branched-chain amino acid transport system substrate-binding protein
MKALLASLSALLLLLATSIAEQTTAAAQTQSPVVIGGSLGLTGQFARLGEELNRGLQIWRDDVNARGGLLGHPVEFKVYDDQSDPTTSAKLYEKLIVQDKVDLLFSAFASPVVFAASAVTEKYKFPMVAAGASAQNIWERGFRYIFQIYPQPEGQVDGLLEVAKSHGLKSIAVATEDSNYTKELAQIVVKMAKEKGMNVVFYEEYGKNPSDLSSLVIKMKAAKPDVFFGATYLPESVLFVRTARELNFNPKLYAFTIGPALDDFVENLKKDADLMTGTTFWEINSTTPGSAEFVKKYQARHQTNPPYQAAASYSGMQILEAAAKKAGSLDREKVRDALAAVDVQTIFGPYKVDEKGAQLAKHAYVLQIQDGKRRLVWPDDVKDADLIFPTPDWSARK